MVDVPNWIVAVGTLGGIALSWFVAKQTARNENERSKMAQVAWQTRIDFMVTEMWASIGRRGTTQAVVSGLGEVHSPLRATPRGRAIFAPLTPEIDEFYRTEGYAYDDALLRAKVENKFGEQIMHDYCIPNAFTQGECVEIVIAIMKEDYDLAMQKK